MSDESKRRENNKAKVLRLLKQKGQAGVTNVELVHTGGLRYGARIYELRADGYQIQTIPVEGGVFRFVLKGQMLLFGEL
jgi:hypothetical protein